MKNDSSLRAKRSNLILKKRDCFVITLLAMTVSMLLFSCGTAEQKPVVIPGSVLPKEKMAEVITDIHITEAKTSLTPYQDSTYAITSFEKIFEKNKITRAQYDSSLVFYIEHPELLDTIYGQVLNELSKMQGETAKGK